MIEHKRVDAMIAAGNILMPVRTAHERATEALSCGASMSEREFHQLLIVEDTLRYAMRLVAELRNMIYEEP